MKSLDQTQKEWLVINAARELLALMTGLSGTRYTKAITFAKDIIPDLFKGSKTGIEKQDYLERLYTKFEQEAIAKSQKRGKQITAIKLIKNRFNELKRLIRQNAGNKSKFDLLKKESDELAILIDQRDSIASTGLQRITENQAISNDFIKNRFDKIFIDQQLGKFSLFKDLKSNSIFRITALHPNPSEAIIGADLIYEQYDESKRKVRIVAVQYKVWEHNTLYFNQSGNIQKQITKMKKCFCAKAYCVNEKSEETSKGKYRLPYCMAFLKPTDKLQDPKKPITSGYHLPICKVDKLKEKTKTDFKLTLDRIKNQSIKASAFEELFDSEMLGSRWMKIKDLQNFYQKNKVLEPNERIILYAQGTREMD